MKPNPFIFALALANLHWTPAFADPGETDKNGCHAGPKPYHCHNDGGRKPGSSSRMTIGDKDCADFSSWRNAQDFYEANKPGDPHNLDADNDGIACETLRQ